MIHETDRTQFSEANTTSVGIEPTAAPAPINTTDQHPDAIATLQRHFVLKERECALVRKLDGARSSLPAWAASGPSLEKANGEFDLAVSGWPKIAIWEHPTDERVKQNIRPSLREVKTRFDGWFMGSGNKAWNDKKRVAVRRWIARYREQQALKECAGLPELNAGHDAVWLEIDQNIDRFLERTNTDPHPDAVVTGILLVFLRDGVFEMSQDGLEAGDRMLLRLLSQMLPLVSPPIAKAAREGLAIADSPISDGEIIPSSYDLDKPLNVGGWVTPVEPQHGRCR